jgi:phosphoserine phosphatase
VPILDIGQTVIQRLLSLFILFEPGEPALETDLLRELQAKADEMGLILESRPIAADSGAREGLASPAQRYAITLLAERVPAAALHEVTTALARHDLNIDVIEKLSDADFGCVEMLVSSAQAISPSPLKKLLLGIATRQKVDIALQAEGLYRRSKRLVVFDMDSTLIQSEVIDELAREHGVFDEVHRITEEAMRGKMNYDESLKLRCAKLKGLSAERIDSVYRRIELTPGADELIRVLKRLGYKTAVISGGFNCITEPLRNRLGIDFAYANQLEFAQGKLTGKVLPPVINAARKADLLEVIAQQEKIHLDQVIAIGDGANDLLMLERAGLGIAFNAKPIVRKRADLAISQKNLRSVLYLLGFSGRDLTEALSLS